MANQPIKMTREELYRRMWETPKSQLAVEFGISDNGLAKICKRLRIPCPPRGYWTRRRLGLISSRDPLPKPDETTPATVTITPSSLRSFPGLGRQSGGFSAADLKVPDELQQPHRLVQAWLGGRLERELSEMDGRRYRILDTILRAVEPMGLVPKADGDRFCFEFESERIICSLERASKPIRGLTVDQIRGRPELSIAPSILRFTIDSYFPPMYAIRRRWSDSKAEPLESKVGSIVETLLAAGPILVRIRQDRAE